MVLLSTTTKLFLSARISSGWCLVQRTTGQERNISVTIAGSATGNVGTVHTQLNHLYLETDSVSEF